MPQQNAIKYETPMQTDTRRAGNTRELLVVEEENTDQPKRRVRLIRDLKAATPSPVKQGSSEKFHNCTHAGINDLPNYTVRHQGTSRYL